MRYVNMDHFYENQGMLTTWIRNELGATIIDVSRLSSLTVKEIEGFEQGYTSNSLYDKCLKALIEYARETNQSFTELMYRLYDVKSR
ncbi:hypothetical protein [Paenibacillus sp. LK1]|uniref:hypothetical protein n=1 Tax=Paenibacillus sp. LK1 TaxID=2053014 RepID=UPI000C177BFE|nr:hypothetical protein [Paenibacillus sp. LK1]PIH59675.1 hypothetical protein CS562_06975 [Paenibacillus sp. LK1]